MGIKIPGYDGPQVKQAAAPTPNVVVQVPNMQEGITKAVGAGLQVLDDAVQRANQARVDEQKYSLMRESKAIEMRLKSLQGADAVKPELVEPIMKQWEEVIKRHEDALSSPGQKSAFKQAAAGIDTGLRVSMGAHMGEQSMRWEQSVNLNGSETYINEAKSSAISKKAWLDNMTKSEELFRTANSGVDTTETLKDRRSKAALEAYLSFTKSGVHPDMLQHLTEDMRQEDHVKAKELGMGNQALSLSTQIYRQGASLSSMEADARKLTGGKEDLYNKTMAHIKERYAIDEKSADDQSDEVVSDILNKMRVGKISPSLAESQLLSLNVTEKARGRGLVQVGTYREHQLALIEKRESIADRRLKAGSQREVLRTIYSPEIATWSNSTFEKFVDGIHPDYHPTLYSARNSALNTKGKAQISKTAIDLVLANGTVKEKDPLLLSAVAQASAYFEEEMKPGGSLFGKEPSDVMKAMRVNFYLKPRETTSIWGSTTSLAEIRSKALAGKSPKDSIEEIRKGLGFELPIVGKWIEKNPDKFNINNVENWFEAVDELEVMKTIDLPTYVKLSKEAYPNGDPRLQKVSVPNIKR